MNNLSDFDLVRLSVGGNADAFEVLVNRHYAGVYRHAYKWCGLRQDAEDITQEVFAKLARNLKAFNLKSAFRTWLYRITVNTAKDYLRKNKTKHAYEATFAVEGHQKNPGPTQEQYVEAARMYRELGKLPQKQKAAMLLVFGEGMSHREAAAVLNCRETTISWRIFQARKKLNQTLGREI